MNTQIDQLANSFVESIGTFRVDMTLAALDLPQIDQPFSPLAASGRAQWRSEYERVGVLSNTKRDLLVRVFHHKSDARFRLYFLHDAYPSLNGAVLTSLDMYKFFVVNHENQVTIPDVAGIDPIHDPLTLTMPDFQMQIPCDEIGQTVVSDNGLAVLVQTTSTSEDGSAIIECALSGEYISRFPTKILCRTDNFSLLVPVQNCWAYIHIPQNLSSSLDCFCYE